MPHVFVFSFTSRVLLTSLLLLMMPMCGFCSGVCVCVSLLNMCMCAWAYMSLLVLCVCVLRRVPNAETVCFGGTDRDCYPCHIPLGNIYMCVFMWLLEVGGKLSLPTTAYSLTHQPKSQLCQQKPNTNTLPIEVTEKIICRNGCSDWHGSKWNLFPRRLFTVVCVYVCVCVSISSREGIFLLIPSDWQHDRQGGAGTGRQTAEILQSTTNSGTYTHIQAAVRNKTWINYDTHRKIRLNDPSSPLLHLWRVILWVNASRNHLRCFLV